MLEGAAPRSHILIETFKKKKLLESTLSKFWYTKISNNQMNTSEHLIKKEATFKKLLYKVRERQVRYVESK